MFNVWKQLFYSFSDVFESLAWASAQIHCQCTANGKVVLTEKLNTTSQLAAINASKNMFLVIFSFF